MQKYWKRLVVCEFTVIGVGIILYLSSPHSKEWTLFYVIWVWIFAIVAMPEEFLKGL